MVGVDDHPASKPQSGEEVVPAIEVGRREITSDEDHRPVAERNADCARLPGSHFPEQDVGVGRHVEQLC
jgi:hypothetical protein